MAADAEAILKTEKPCCAKRKERFLKLKENRDFLRNALLGVEPKVVLLQNEKLSAVKAYEVERERAELEKQAKENESAVRAGLEKEILDLKSEIASLQLNKALGDQDDNGEVSLLRTCVSELDGEIYGLKGLLEEEREKGDLERKRVEAEKKQAEEACEVEKEAKLNESAIRARLENEILELKSEIALLKESGGTIDRDEDGELILLQTRASEGKAEICRLSELLDKERKSRESEKKKAQVEKKKAEEALKIEADARSKECSVRAGLENEMVLLRTRVSEGEAEISRLIELLDKERKDGELEKKRVQAEKKKAEDAWKIEAEARSKEISVRAGLENEIVTLQTRVSEAEAEICRLKELLDQERKKAGSEKKKTKAVKKKADAQKLETEAKLKESAGLENEILKLKSEIASLQGKRGLRDQDEGGKALLLRSRVSEGEAEIQRLNELLEKEKNMKESEKKCVEEEKKKLMDEKNRSDYLSQKLEEAKQMANREKQHAESERQKVEEQKKCVEEEKKKLMDEKNRSGYLYQQLEAAKQMTNREKKRAESERAKVEEQKKCVEEEKKKLMDEKKQSDYLSQKLEEAKQMANREKKHAESERAKVEERKKCEEEKKKLEEVRQKSESLEKEIMSAKKMKEVLTVTSDVNRNAGEDLMLLERQLKLEKMHVKHAKRVAKFEKTRNNLLEQELYRLKQEFFHFSYRLNELDGCFSNDVEGIDVTAKINNSIKLQSSNGNDKFSGKEPFSLYGNSENELVKARYTSMGCFDRFRSTIEFSTPLSDGSSTKSISGISSTLKSVIGGSVGNKLQNSAIYSTSTSFSDRPLVGSQENNIFSVPRPDNLIENLKHGPTVSRLSEITKLKINGNHGVMVENSVRTPVHRDMENPRLSLNEHDGIRVAGGDPGPKRKRLPDEVESIKCLCTELKNFSTRIEENLTAVNDALILENNMPTAICSQIDGKLNTLGDGRCPSAALLVNDLHARNYRSSKKRKVSQQKHILEPGSKEVNNLTDNLETELTKDGGGFNQTIPHANHFLENVQTHRDETVNTVETNQETEVYFEKMTSEGIMKLLELNDPDDEERFRMAMERPLSPTLPEVEMPNIEAFEVDGSIISEEGIYRGLASQIDNMVKSCRVDVINVESDSNRLKFKSSGNSHCSELHQLEGSDRKIGEPQDEDVALHITTDTGNMFSFQVSKSSTEMKVAKQASRYEVMEVPYTNCEGHKRESIPQYFVAFPNIKDKDSISRIISAYQTCISNSSTVYQKVWMVDKFLVALAKEEGLLPKEKACVLFSLLLHNFLMVTSVNFRNFVADDIHSCSDSFLTHLKTVMADAGTRNILLELFQLDTLFNLIESFLMDKRGMVYKYQPHSQCDSQSITLLDGTSILLSSETATTDKLVAGSFILASICATTGHIGFICEVSYKFLRRHRSDSYLTLTVFHVFASLCGSKYFNLSTHSLIMTVLRSIVTLLERENVAIDATCGSYTRYASESRPRFPPCAQCIFSKSVASVDEVLSLLLEKLQDYTVTMTGHQPNADVSDIFSSVELLGYYMSWDWTWSKIIPRLLKMVESCLSDKASAAVMLLIGQLGRFGIDDSGSEQLEVEELRCSLAAFLNQKTTCWGLPTQFAIVHALIGLLSVDFEKLVKNEELPPVTSQSACTNLVKAWFSQLSEELKSLSFGILQPADMHGK